MSRHCFRVLELFKWESWDQPVWNVDGLKNKTIGLNMTHCMGPPWVKIKYTAVGQLPRSEISHSLLLCLVGTRHVAYVITVVYVIEVNAVIWF